MSETSASAEQAPQVSAWLVAVAMGAGLAMFAASLLVPAGRLDWCAAWIYLGFLGWILSAPLLLGSWWALVPALLSIAGVVVRTALEDRTLKAELPGYADYAKRLRYRLGPGLW